MRIMPHEIKYWRRPGRKKSGISQAARQAGLEPSTVFKRLKKGWELDEALSTPPIPKDKQLEMARRRIGRKDED